MNMSKQAASLQYCLPSHVCLLGGTKSSLGMTSRHHEAVNKQEKELVHYYWVLPRTPTDDSCCTTLLGGWNYRKGQIGFPVQSTCSSSLFFCHVVSCHNFIRLTCGSYFDIGGVSLLTVPLTGYRNRKIVNCLFTKTAINVRLAQCSPNCYF